jgi:hypothetical protein
MWLGVSSVEIDGLAIEMRSLRETILAREDVPQIVVSLCVNRVELDRRFVATNGFVVASQAFESLSQIIAANCRIRSQGRCALQERERGVEASGLERDDPEQVERVGVLGLELQYLAIAALGLRQPPGSMLLERAREGLINAQRRHGCFFRLPLDFGGTR